MGEIRRAGDYTSADRMRDALQALGIWVEDKTHTFVMPDGQIGSYDLSGGAAATVQGPLGADFESVRAYCLQREEIRKGGDYKTADQMRNNLSAIGVKVEDKTHTFFLPDGMTGS